MGGINTGSCTIYEKEYSADMDTQGEKDLNEFGKPIEFINKKFNANHPIFFFRNNRNDKKKNKCKGCQTKVISVIIKNRF